MKPDSSLQALELLTAVSSIDGRYREATAPLVEYLSEYALIKSRVRVECEYVIALSQQAGSGVRTLTPDEIAILKKIEDVSLDDARLVKKIEKEGHGGVPATNHDVKAVEYFIKEKLKGTTLQDISERVHFALTSEDCNSVAYGLMLRDAFEYAVLPGLAPIETALSAFAEKHAASPMLARTHGQSASPTTFGKEMKVFLERIRKQVRALKVSTISVKIGGATGNYNAHVIAVPSVDWMAFAHTFINALNSDASGTQHSVKLILNEFTTQIEPHDTYAELFDAMRRINTILIDLSQDLWRYISDGWVIQKPKAGEVGSSTMPHKVNPIDFENAEGNFGVANALFEHFSRKLPISRLQRDLSDSTVERVFGTAFAHTLVGYKSLEKGFGKISLNEEVTRAALASHPEVLAEAIQTVLRHEGVENAYEALKDLTRGQAVTMQILSDFIAALPLGEEAKKRLQALTPESYIGLAAQIAVK